MLNSKIRLVALAVICIVLSSCGYGFTHVGGVVPEGSKTIFIPVFLNNTVEPYVDVEVTKAVVDEFLSDGRLKVVGAEGADLVLQGKIAHYEAIPQSYTVDSYVQQYQVQILVDVSITDAKTQKVLWQENGIGSVFVSSYPVSIGDINTTKIAKEAAMKKASQDVAWTIRSRVLEGF